MNTALVTGASRGVGYGVATALAEAKYRVFATGRNITASALPDGIRKIVCDHSRRADTERVFATLKRETTGLDLLVNAAWGGYENMVEDGRFTWNVPFWEQSSHRWNAMMDTGLRAAFECSQYAARLMIPKRSGLIVNLSFWAAQKYIGNTIYGIAKAATDKMSADMAHELRPHGVAVVSLYPGLVRTELVLKAAESGAFDLENSESPQFCGRVIARLMETTDLMERTGATLIAAALARELGILDVDGSSPRPLSSGDV